ncbi:MAG: copper-binding protein, partial [Rhodothermales bacterium]
MLIAHVCRRTGTGINGFLLIALLILTAGCAGERTYEVRGRVAGFGDDAHTLIVEHEDIPGLMPAMTMPFDVLDPTAIENLTVGDAIAFRLSMTGDRSWIEDITVLADDAVAEHPAGRPDPFQPNTERILDRGDRIP